MTIYRHGTRSAYEYLHCSCDRCREAHRDYVRRRRSDRSAGPIPDSVTHGSSSTYINWGCRCGACTAANTADCRSYQENRRRVSKDASW